MPADHEKLGLGTLAEALTEIRVAVQSLLNQVDSALQEIGTQEFGNTYKAYISGHSCRVSQCEYEALMSEDRTIFVDYNERVVTLGVAEDRISCRCSVAVLKTLAAAGIHGHMAFGAEHIARACNSRGDVTPNQARQYVLATRKFLESHGYRRDLIVARRRLRGEGGCPANYELSEYAKVAVITKHNDKPNVSKEDATKHR